MKNTKTITKSIEILMKKKLSSERSDGLGMGCTAALKISTIAFVGVAAVQLSNNFGYLTGIEQSAKRVMWMSVIIGGSSVLGGTVAGALSIKQSNYFVDTIIEERKKIEKLELDNYFIKKQAKSLRKEVETERTERINRGDKLRQKQQRIERLEEEVKVLKLCLPTGSQLLADWLDWEELVQELWGTEYCVSNCRGCKYLDVSSYEDRYLICAMHPYGKKDCSEWKAKS